MPTVSNHDVLGPMTWGAGGNSRQRYFPQDSLDRSDARGGINSLLFEESGAADACGARTGVAAASEHAYSASACHRNTLVSANGYYGFHQQHGVHGVGAAVAGQDCSMDTSENNPPVPASGGSPSAGALGFGGEAPQGVAFPFGPAQHGWNAQADPFRNHGATRKRNLEARARGVGGWQGWRDAGLAGLADADDMAGRAKRTRPSTSSPSDAAEAMTEAPSQAMPQGVCAPSTSEQSHSPAQMYELPIHQLPGSTSQLVDAMTPRPRCLMGHFI